MADPEFFCYCEKCLSGIPDRSFGNAEGETAIAGTCKARSLNKKEILLGADLRELFISQSLRSVHEDVERAVGLNCIKACINDVGVKKVSSVLVVCNIDFCVDGLFDYFLPDGRSRSHL